MNNTDLKVFLEVKNARNITKAAENLYLSQSTVSSRLKALEQELGVCLVVRSKGQKNIGLTPEGETFVSIAERMLLLNDEAKTLSQRNHRIYLTVGGVDSLSTYMLPKFYAQLIENHLGFRLLIRHTRELYEMLESREIDVGIVNTVALYPDIQTKLLFREKFVLLRAGEEEGEQIIHPRELDPSLEIYQYFNPEYVQWHNYWWHSWQTPVEIDNVALIEMINYNKDLWTIVPYSVAQAFTNRPGLVWHYLSEPPPERTCYAIIHKYPRTYMAASIDHFLDEMVSFIQKTGFASPQ